MSVGATLWSLVITVVLGVYFIVISDVDAFILYTWGEVVALLEGTLRAWSQFFPTVGGAKLEVSKWRSSGLFSVVRQGDVLPPVFLVRVFLGEYSTGFASVTNRSGRGVEG